MTSYQPQLSMSPPPALPAHHEMSPSPTPTVNPDPYMSNKSNEKFGKQVYKHDTLTMYLICQFI